MPRSLQAPVNLLPSSVYKPVNNNAEAAFRQDKVVTTKTLRRRYSSPVGRLTHSERRLILHLTRSWSWQAASCLTAAISLPHPSQACLTKVCSTHAI